MDTYKFQSHYMRGSGGLFVVEGRDESKSLSDPRGYWYYITDSSTQREINRMIAEERPALVQAFENVRRQRLAERGM